MHRALRVFLGTSLGLLILDQAVKAWARGAADGIEGRALWALWPGVFELKLLYNYGVAFGMLQGKGVWMTPIALAMAGYAGWHSWKHKDEPTLVHFTTAALAAGAIGNLIDRVWMGKVTDMFWFRIINFPVFNIADVCITFAGCMLVLGSFLDAFKKQPAPEKTDPV
jgi:signal peptidase II